MLPTPPRFSSQALIFLLILLVVKAGSLLWLQQLARRSATRVHSYVGDDYPRAWPIPMAGPVLMPLENTRRYMIDGPESNQEWDAAVPGNGMIYLGEQKRKFSISMFHQLRCISHLRKEMFSAQKTGIMKPDSQLNQHCLNYMRQMLFCASDTILDEVLSPVSHPLVVPEFFECKDWSLIYDAVERNQRENRPS
ncbi:N-acetyltransferase domain-containing protein [Favolaschia claudopus]|uniref:N-acetyltransferase domain-containing protein n=1 Tax=Favolaschia claudopus TaxID=2862362 RepID=A0AAW0C2I2_9AGAR